jgi:hypothetical protein
VIGALEAKLRKLKRNPHRERAPPLLVDLRGEEGRVRGNPVAVN